MQTHLISSEPVGFGTLRKLLDGGIILELSERSRADVKMCRDYLDRRIADRDEPIYGVTTGFGSLCNHSISKTDLGILQRNLVMSHACGMGSEVPDSIVGLMMFLKIQSLSYGHSGIRLRTLERLIEFYNNGIYPIVYTQGSLGASGDLAPLAHLSLPLLGLGEVNFRGKRKRAAVVLKEMGWEPLDLAAKEGLALLNGTQFMSAYGSYILLRVMDLTLWSDIIASMSLEAFNGRIEAFFEQVHRIRHHGGQIRTASNIMKILKGSRLTGTNKDHVQDPYSFRCIPQVHGASKDAIDYVKGVFHNEVNAVTDNPTLFPDDDLIISGGNFHGQPLALSLDFLTLALAEMANISERRIYRLISGARGLPSFLVANPGLNSGFMIPQYTAASIVSQNKQLCTPASVDSIESSQGQEDHVSMGANAAVKALSVVENLEKVLAIELLTASQAMGFREASRTSPMLKKLLDAFKRKVPFIENDKVMYEEMKKAELFIRKNSPEIFFSQEG